VRKDTTWDRVAHCLLLFRPSALQPDHPARCPGPGPAHRAGVPLRDPDPRPARRGGRTAALARQSVSSPRPTSHSLRRRNRRHWSGSSPNSPVITPTTTGCPTNCRAARPSAIFAPSAATSPWRAAPPRLTWETTRAIRPHPSSRTMVPAKRAARGLGLSAVPEGAPRYRNRRGAVGTRGHHPERGRFHRGHRRRADVLRERQGRVIEVAQVETGSSLIPDSGCRRRTRRPRTMPAVSVFDAMREPLMTTWPVVTETCHPKSDS
jgi:hypothetical protein